MLLNIFNVQDRTLYKKTIQSKLLIFIGRTDVEAEAPILWPLDTKSWLIRKDPDAGKNWRQEKGMTEDEIAGWHHWLDGCEFEQALGVSDGQGSLVCCSPWGRKEWDTTERLNWLKWYSVYFLRRMNWKAKTVYVSRQLVLLVSHAFLYFFWAETQSDFVLFTVFVLT